MPASRRVSRQASVDREMGAANNRNKRGRMRTRRASVEVFNATYEMKLKKGSVTKISSTHEIYDKKVEVKKENEDAVSDDDNCERKLDVGQKGEGQGMSQKEDLEGKQTEGSVEKNNEHDLKISKDEGDDANNNDANNNKGVGDALRGLSKALESLQEQQMAQKAKLIKGGANKNNNSNGKKKSSNRNSRTASATVSLTSSRRGSRSCTPDRSSTGSKLRARLHYLTK